MSKFPYRKARPSSLIKKGYCYSMKCSPQFLLVSIISFSLCIPHQVFAQEEQNEVAETENSKQEPPLALTPAANPHSSGIGYLISGIIVTSVLGGVGGIFALGFPYSSGEDVCEEQYTEKEKEDCRKEDDKEEKQGRLTGLGVALVGVGVGVPLILVGKNKLAKWKDWRKKNLRKSKASIAPTEDTLSLGLRVDLHNVSAALSYRF
jgi:hypothetical protein